MGGGGVFHPPSVDRCDARCLPRGRGQKCRPHDPLSRISSNNSESGVPPCPQDREANGYDVANRNVRSPPPPRLRICPPGKQNPKLVPQRPCKPSLALDWHGNLALPMAKAQAQHTWKNQGSPKPRRNPINKTFAHYSNNVPGFSVPQCLL